MHTLIGCRTLIIVVRIFVSLLFNLINH